MIDEFFEHAEILLAFGIIEVSFRYLLYEFINCSLGHEFKSLLFAVVIVESLLIDFFLLLLPHLFFLVFSPSCQTIDVVLQLIVLLAFEGSVGVLNSMDLSE